MNIDTVMKYMNQPTSYGYYYDDIYHRTNFPLETHRIIFKAIRYYLDYVLYSPSTVNKIITHISLDVDPNNPKCICIMFDDEIIRRYLVVGGLNCYD